MQSPWKTTIVYIRSVNQKYILSDDSYPHFNLFTPFDVSKDTF